MAGISVLLKKIEERFQQMLLEQASINHIELPVSSSDTLVPCLDKKSHDSDGVVVIVLL